MPYHRPHSTLGYLSSTSTKQKTSIENLSIGKKNSFANVISWSSKFKQETSLIKKYSDTVKNIENNFNHNTINYDFIIDSLKKKNLSLTNQNSTHIQKNQELQQKLNEVNLCEICFENKKNILCVPCNHISICSTCSNHINSKCPICRTPVTETKKVYL
tara:strand:+ start:75 stop:551 length:477 start_codon:yes stop_codon:yes gene_type:complete